MKSRKALSAIMALTLAFTPSLAGCEEVFEDVLIGVLTGFEKPPVPSVKEGRFDFSVTYEVDGEIKTISSVYVCKYVESTMWLDGWGITWDAYIEDKEIAMLPPDNNYNLSIVETNDDGTIYLDLSLNERYFMSQPAEGRVSMPYLYIQYNERAAEEKGTYGDEDAAVIESYGVKIIEYEYAAPIENIYK